ncbi:MAG TPA: phosphate ABC transporter substrate-binding protein PstS [Alphaproteobacteria bacterium]|nr:phosphate ABC transporter substrate-binding protein PstS [Alphaproteobacteria bacterium]
MSKRFSAMMAAAALCLAFSGAEAATLTGAGGTAIYPVLSKWADTYAKERGDSVNYQAIGSGGGIKQIEEKTVLFANTDKPLQPDELDKNGIIQFPQVIISIVPVVNLKDIKSGELVFDGPTLADIYLGKIKEWDDPAIKKLNPSAKLSHEAITVVHRSDGSGTTFNFTDYLGKVSPEWKTKVGEDTSVSWPVGVGGKGNAGVANYVQQVGGAIGYVEYAYAMENHLTYADMINKEGKRLAPTMAAFQAAAANADFSKVQNFYLILTDQPGAKSWPITAATYMLMRKDGDPAQNKLALEFLDWALRKGQDQARALDYVPLPEPVIMQIETSWARDLKGADGKPIWNAAATN